MSIITVVIAISSIILLAIPGFLLKKFKMLNQSVIKGLSVILIYVCQPFLTLSNFLQHEYSPETSINILWVALVAAGGLAVLGVFAYFVFNPKKHKNNSDELRVFTFASIFSNCGFMGIPFLQALFPGNSEVIIYACVFVAIFNIFVWTVGVYLLTGNKKHISFKSALLNPATIALIISLPLYFANFKLEGDFLPILNSFALIGNMTTPLSMTILGIRLADIKLKELFVGKNIYVSMIIKLLVAPIIMFILLSFLDLSYQVKAVLYIVMAMPTAAVTLTFSEKFMGDCKIAAISFMSSTLFSLLTLPLMLLLVPML